MNPEQNNDSPLIQIFSEFLENNYPAIWKNISEIVYYKPSEPLENEADRNEEIKIGPPLKALRVETGPNSNSVKNDLVSFFQETLKLSPQVILASKYFYISESDILSISEIRTTYSQQHPEFFLTDFLNEITNLEISEFIFCKDGLAHVSLFHFFGFGYKYSDKDNHEGFYFLGFSVEEDGMSSKYQLGSKSISKICLKEKVFIFFNETKFQEDIAQKLLHPSSDCLVSVNSLIAKGWLRIANNYYANRHALQNKSKFFDQMKSTVDRYGLDDFEELAALPEMRRFYPLLHPSNHSSEVQAFPGELLCEVFSYVTQISRNWSTLFSKYHKIHENHFEDVKSDTKENTLTKNLSPG